jgi:murein DD-endopeptidase MepM/ murein hydrolase activator NlpD
MTITLGELTNEQRLTLLEQRVLHLENVVGDALEGPGTPPRVLFCSPVTGQISTTDNPFGGAWFDATGYATYYTVGTPAYHTGADLNLNSPVAYSDSGAPVYCAADGVIVFAGSVPGWQAQVVIVEHTLEDGTKVWTRYAHIKDVPQIGMARVPVKRGAIIGVIADYTPTGSKQGDHLHFDVCKIDLGKKPADWPGLALVSLKRDYLDPAAWLKERAA